MLDEAERPARQSRYPSGTLTVCREAGADGHAMRVVSQAARARVDLPLRDLPVPDAVPRA
ncbi:hypothetical protein EMIT0158MI4_170021 [Burkholderia ambifaria]